MGGASFEEECGGRFIGVFSICVSEYLGDRSVVVFFLGLFKREFCIFLGFLVRFFKVSFLVFGG